MAMGIGIWPMFEPDSAFVLDWRTGWKVFGVCG